MSFFDTDFSAILMLTLHYKCKQAYTYVLGISIKVFNKLCKDFQVRKKIPFLEFL